MGQLRDGNSTLSPKARYTTATDIFRFTDNRLRGFQAGNKRSPLQGLSYRLLTPTAAHGHADAPRSRKAHSTSVMLEDATSSLK